MTYKTNGIIRICIQSVVYSKLILTKHSHNPIRHYCTEIYVETLIMYLKEI
jgi:hypothetical protein